MNIIMPFIIQGEDFTLGVEIGIVWEKFEQGAEIRNYMVHQKNIDQIRMICKVFGSSLSVEHINEEFSQITVHNDGVDSLLDSIRVDN